MRRRITDGGEKRRQQRRCSVAPDLAQSDSRPSAIRSTRRAHAAVAGFDRDDPLRFVPRVPSRRAVTPAAAPRKSRPHLSSTCGAGHPRRATSRVSDRFASVMRERQLVYRFRRNGGDARVDDSTKQRRHRGRQHPEHRRRRTLRITIATRRTSLLGARTRAADVIDRRRCRLESRPRCATSERNTAGKSSAYLNAKCSAPARAACNTSRPGALSSRHATTIGSCGHQDLMRRTSAPTAVPRRPRRPITTSEGHSSRKLSTSESPPGWNSSTKDGSLVRAMTARPSASSLPTNDNDSGKHVNLTQ